MSDNQDNRDTSVKGDINLQDIKNSKLDLQGFGQRAKGIKKNCGNSMGHADDAKPSDTRQDSSKCDEKTLESDVVDQFDLSIEVFDLLIENARKEASEEKVCEQMRQWYDTLAGDLAHLSKSLEEEDPKLYSNLIKMMDKCKGHVSKNNGSKLVFVACRREVLKCLEALKSCFMNKNASMEGRISSNPNDCPTHDVPGVRYNFESTSVAEPGAVPTEVNARGDLLSKSSKDGVAGLSGFLAAKPGAGGGDLVAKSSDQAGLQVEQGSGSLASVDDQDGSLLSMAGIMDTMPKLENDASHSKLKPAFVDTAGVVGNEKETCLILKNGNDDGLKSLSSAIGATTGGARGRGGNKMLTPIEYSAVVSFCADNVLTRDNSENGHKFGVKEIENDSGLKEKHQSVLSMKGKDFKTQPNHVKHAIVMNIIDTYDLLNYDGFRKQLDCYFQRKKIAFSVDSYFKNSYDILKFGANGSNVLANDPIGPNGMKLPKSMFGKGEKFGVSGDNGLGTAAGGKDKSYDANDFFEETGALKAPIFGKKSNMDNGGKDVLVTSNEAESLKKDLLNKKSEEYGKKVASASKRRNMSGLDFEIEAMKAVEEINKDDEDTQKALEESEKEKEKEVETSEKAAKRRKKMSKE